MIFWMHFVFFHQIFLISSICLLHRLKKCAETQEHLQFLLYLILKVMPSSSFRSLFLKFIGFKLYTSFTMF